MQKTNPTKKQHFLPQFYLKHFANEQGELQALKIKDKRISNPRAYQSFGYEHYFYATNTGVPDEVSQHVERWLHQIENRISREFPRIIETISGYGQIQADDRYVIAALISMLWLRSPKMRQQLNSIEENMARRIMRFYAPQRVDRFAIETGTALSSEEREEIIEMMENGSYELQFNNVQHLRFMMETLGFGEAGFTNMFFGMHWKVYLARGNEHFITTDSPVVEWFLPPKGFWGATFLERSKYFALTPTILFELTYSDSIRKVKRKTLFKKDDDLVKTWNMLLVSNAKGVAYSGEHILLDSLVSGYQNPGRLERAYFDKYERPWREYRANNQQL